MLTDFEQIIIAKFLEGDHPVLGVLREQTASLMVTGRDYSPVGVNTYLAVSRQAPRTVPAAFDLSDVAFQFEDDENPGHAVLMVRDGQLNELMVYNWTDVWPARPNLRLKWVKFLTPNRKGGAAHPSDQRDVAGLADELAA